MTEWTAIATVPPPAPAADPGQPAGPAAGTSDVGRGVTMLLVLALLGVILVGGVALGVAVRRARRLRIAAANKRTTEPVDVWAKAGERARPEDAVDPDEDEPDRDGPSSDEPDTRSG